MVSSFDFLGNEIKYFDRIISLGSTCQVAHQLRRLGLRQESMPFDWLFSCFDDDLFIESIRSDFKDWLSFDNLKVDDFTPTTHLRVIDTHYNMIHQHVFPLDVDISESYAEVNLTVQKRVGRFLDLKDKNLDLLFIRTNMSMDKAKELSSVLTSKYGPNAILLVINHKLEEGMRLISNEIPGLSIFEMYDNNVNNDGDWRGTDSLWSKLLLNVRLKESFFDMRSDRYFENTFPCEFDMDNHYFRWGQKDATIILSNHIGQYARATLKVLRPVIVDFLDVNGKLLKKVKIHSQTDLCFKVEGDKYVFRVNETISPSSINGGNDTRELGVLIYNVFLSTNELKPIIKDDVIKTNLVVNILRRVRNKLRSIIKK